MANNKGDKFDHHHRLVDNEFQYQPFDEYQLSSSGGASSDETRMFSTVRREREMSVMVSALTHVVAGDDCVQLLHHQGSDELMDYMNGASTESSFHGHGSSSSSSSCSGHKRGREENKIQSSQDFSSLRGIILKNLIFFLIIFEKLSL